jgi:catechol 2,3-dioxygenase-like lactoylglutathione lyase family enzyme
MSNSSSQSQGFDIRLTIKEHTMTISPDLALAPLLPTPESGRVQLALNVDVLAEAVTFYSKLFGTGPAKLRPGYANFSLATPPLKLVLLENPGQGGTLNHLGVEVPSTEVVRAEITRLAGEGLVTDEERGTTCCFATQDKVWVAGPDAERWEVYTVLADSETFGSSPQTAGDQGSESGVCCGAAQEPASACC